MDQFQGVDVRCSAVVFRGREVLLVRRFRDEASDWVLPGGTPLRARAWPPAPAGRHKRKPG
jgi:8-oxo-dGTP pyrophosphatase MutT (NUDIX family)